MCLSQALIVAQEHRHGSEWDQPVPGACSFVLRANTPRYAKIRGGGKHAESMQGCGSAFLFLDDALDSAVSPDDLLFFAQDIRWQVVLVCPSRIV